MGLIYGDIPLERDHFSTFLGSIIYQRVDSFKDLPTKRRQILFFGARYLRKGDIYGTVPVQEQFTESDTMENGVLLWDSAFFLLHILRISKPNVDVYRSFSIVLWYSKALGP